MIYFGLYLLVGAIAFLWTISRGKSHEDEFFICFLMLADPLGWIAWLLWPLALPIHLNEKRVHARTLMEEEIKSDPIEPERLSLLGVHATAVTRMCPTGLVKIGDEHREAQSEDGVVDPGERVVVVAERDSRLVIRRMSNKTAHTTAGNAPV